MCVGIKLNTGNVVPERELTCVCSEDIYCHMLMKRAPVGYVKIYQSSGRCKCSFHSNTAVA